MQKLLVLLLLLLPAAWLQAQSKSGKEPFLTKSFAGQAIKTVEAQTSGGSLTVSGSAASEARIEVFIHPNNGKDNLSKEELQKRLDEKYDLRIDVSGNKLTATARPKEKIKDWKNALSISFQVYVPQNTSTDLSTSGGSISLSGLSGKHKFTTSGGSLDVKGLSGTINGRTSGGSINVEDSKEDIELITSGGSITARNCEGKIRLTTSGGSLELNGLKGDIKASTSGGSVDGKNIQGELSAFTSGGSIHLDDLACSLETGTSAGTIDVSFRELGKYVKISNSAGNVNLRIPKGKGLDLKLSARKIETGAFDNFNGKMEDDEVEGKLNGGGVAVTVKSSSGRINLDLK